MASHTYISLFSGVGGLDRGLRIACPETRCVCYVEREREAVETLVARITEGKLDDAPVWSDVTTFDGRAWRGLVDGIIGGFPCQDLSIAGKRTGIVKGRRSGLWSEYLRLIEEVKPSWVFLENVPGIFNVAGSDLESEDEADGDSAGGYVRNIEYVLGPLSDLGFHAEWLCLPASDLGFAHKRNRWFCLAWKPGFARRLHAGPRGPREAETNVGWSERAVAFTGCTRERRSKEQAGVACSELADTRRECDQRCGLEMVRAPGAAEADGEQRQRGWHAACGGGIIAIPGPGLGGAGVVDKLIELYARDPEAAWRSYQAELRNTLRWQDLLVRYPWLQPAISQEEVESYFHGLPDGMARMVVDERTSALRAAGNGVVSLQAAVAFTELLKKII